MPRLHDISRGLRKLWLMCLKHTRLLIVVGAVFVALVLLITWALVANGSASRTEAYKTVKGGAGLKAVINYDCAMPCKQKYNFNVYILQENGQQVGVFRPDQNGAVQAALNEGNYIMLIGKQFGKDKLFPQEPLVLRNGQLLELKLHY